MGPERLESGSSWSPALVLAWKKTTSEPQHLPHLSPQSPTPLTLSLPIPLYAMSSLNTELTSKLVPSFPHFSISPPGVPITEVFTLKPLEFGKPNTLVCFVSNLFPPTLTVNWQHHSAPVEGVGPTYVSAVDGLSFQAFSYLNFTPVSSDIFSCIVTHEIDGHTAIAYWGETLLLGSLVHFGDKRG